MIGRAALFGLALSGSLPASVAAQAADACADATTTVQIEACTRRQAESAERELNVTYARIRSALASDPACKTCLDARAALTVAQRTWIDFRRRDCDALARYHADGTIRGAAVSGCLAGHARQRSAQLRAHFESDR